MKIAIPLLALACFLPLPLSAAGLRCAGVLGNSGEQGATLVRFGGGSFQGSLTSRGGARGLGVVADRFGSLWDRGGAGVLNRYSPDGRLLGAYRIPAENDDSDAIALAGDSLLLLINHRLLALDVNAPNGASAVDLKVEADCLSLETREGQAAAGLRNGEIFLVDAQGVKKPLTVLPAPGPDGVSLAPDGAVMVRRGGKILRLPPENPDKPVELGAPPGERVQFLDRFCYGHSHHSTVRRFSAELQPEPGVVMGGNSGSFIGHVDEQAEVGMGMGLARLGPGLFAVSGQSCVLHLLEWREEEVRFQPLRRIGAVERCAALALDRKGRVWFRSGSWNWDDGPASPLRFGVPEPEAVFGLTMLESDTVMGYGRMWNRPAIVTGGFEKEARLRRVEESVPLPESPVASTVIQWENRPLLVILGGDGALAAMRVKPDGDFERLGPAMKLEPAAPVKEWTSLVSADGRNLLAAGDGFVMEFQPDDGGGTWREARRWNAPGAGDADRFGPVIHLAADAGRLWVSDTARHRVVCLNAATRATVAVFGAADQAGDDLGHLSAPATLACRDHRAVVFDSGNQRLMKLEFVP